MALMDLGTTTLMETAGKMAFSYLLALPVGFEREREERGVGIRTFPIVAIASCGYMLVAAKSGENGTDLRALQGLMTGIGFIGGGAILREGATIHGTATAASVWATGATGAAVALGRLDIAILLAIFNLFTLRALLPIKRRLDARKDPDSSSAGR